MRVLITGVTGLLGQALLQAAEPTEKVFGVYFPARDLPEPMAAVTRVANVTEPAEMRAAFDWARPDVVIHTAAIGSVDFAEKNREQTRAVNVGGTQVVADLCREFQVRLVYISSNAVFDGLHPFYSETSPVNPINYYGQLKVEAEQVAQASGVPCAIVRPILMYGWPYPGERDNPVVWWVKSLRAHKPLNIVDNVHSNPLPAWSCAEVIWAVVRRNKTGLYHAAGADHLTLYEFAQHTAEVFELDASLLTPVPDSFFPALAPRPQDTSFDTTKMQTDLGLRPVTVREGLVRMKAEQPN